MLSCNNAMVGRASIICHVIFVVGFIYIAEGQIEINGKLVGLGRTFPKLKHQGLLYASHLEL